MFFLASSKPNEIIMNGTITAFMSKVWWTCRPRNSKVYATGKNGGPKLPNEKAFNSSSGFQRTFLSMEKSFLAQVPTFTPHENTDGKSSIFIYADIFLWSLGLTFDQTIAPQRDLEKI